jgi:hypothetical protein
MAFRGDKFKNTGELVNSAKNAFKANDIENKMNSLASTVIEGASAVIGKFKRIKTLLNFLDGVPGEKKVISAKSNFPSGEKDWRVRLSLPQQIIQMGITSNDILAPLVDTNGLVFPTNPTVLVSQEANYNSLHPVHTNYPFWAYQNSQVGQMTITANFPVQNSLEARYWLACIHYLRTVTKMNYGKGPGAGEPPPVVKFNGYGDYVFKNVPVIVTGFQFDMPQDVDYISTGLGDPGSTLPGSKSNFPETAWAPTTSLLTVSIVPQYSRRDVSNFNMKRFVKGDYGKGDTGFI